MKKLLFATVFASTALASSMGCNTDTLTGLHFGLGVSVLFDKYEADVDVATITSVDNTGLKAVQFSTNNYITKKLLSGSYDKWTALMNNVFNSSGTIADEQEVNNTVVIATATATTTTTTTTAYVKRNTFIKRTTNCGGEIKLAYFHDFGNHLMIGVDLTGIIASKNKKTIKVNPATINPIAENPTLELSSGGVKYLTAAYDADGSKYGDAVLETGVLNSYTNDDDKVIAEKTTVTVSNTQAVYEANTGFHTIIPVGSGVTNTHTSLNTSANAPGELTFEKSVFNPRLAFIIGGTVYGWFAGLRMGMSYTTGKVYAKGGDQLGQDKMSKTVSISSPLIGLHLMKQMKIAGNNDAHLYLTADWNIGDGRRSVYMNGVRNFKQSGYNISAGLTWRFKLGN